MAGSEACQRTEECYQWLGERVAYFGCREEICWQLRVRRNERATLGWRNNSVPDPAQHQPAWSPRKDAVLAHTNDPATLQVIRDFLEPLGFKVEVAPAPDAHSLDAD